MRDEHAFPHLRIRDSVIQVEGGLSKREYFAGLAMQGLISTYTISRDEITLGTAETAVRYADALIVELAEDRK